MTVYGRVVRLARRSGLSRQLEKTQWRVLRGKVKNTKAEVQAHMEKVTGTDIEKQRYNGMLGWCKVISFFKVANSQKSEGL